MAKARVIGKRSTNSTDRHIGLRIRTRRLALGKTQEWLGEKLGLTFQQVQKYEKGANRVGGSRLVQIASALQTDPSFFFESTPSSDAVGGPAAVNGVRTSDDPLDGFLATRAGVELARAFMKIKDSTRKSLLVRIAEEFAGK